MIHWDKKKFRKLSRRILFHLLCEEKEQFLSEEKLSVLTIVFNIHINVHNVDSSKGTVQPKLRGVELNIKWFIFTNYCSPHFKNASHTHASVSEKSSKIVFL